MRQRIGAQNRRITKAGSSSGLPEKQCRLLCVFPLHSDSPLERTRRLRRAKQVVHDVSRKGSARYEHCIGIAVFVKSMG
jgi:hypothetical protein